MSRYLIEKTTLTNIANAIRSKYGTSEPIIAKDFATKIENIPSGGEDFLEQRITNTLTEYSNNNITKIKGSAFYSCTKLEKVNLPNVVSIGSQAFRGCSSLTEINFPYATGYMEYAFAGCSMLEKASVPNTTLLGTQTFSGCKKLKKIDLPKITSMGSPFPGCTELVTVILRPSKMVAIVSNATHAFTDTPIAKGTGYIYVPKALIEDYKIATNWSVYADQFRAIEDYPDICEVTE